MTKIVKNRDFSKADLSYAHADEWIFFRCKFDRANLANSTFENAQFINCSFNRASWNHSNLAGVEFKNDPNWEHKSEKCQYNELKDDPRNDGIGWPKLTEEDTLTDLPQCSGILSSFHRSNLVSSVVGGYSFDDSDFSEADLTGASFSKTSLDHCNFNNIRFVNDTESFRANDTPVLFGEETSLEFADFAGTNLKGLRFQKCKSLEAANFRRADLAGVIFEGDQTQLMPLYRACFDFARLTEAKFNNCIIDSASYIGGDLQQVKFQGKTHGVAANFSNSYLAGCQAEDVDFTAANFSNSFIGTVLIGGEGSASFAGATLISAIFSNAALIGVNFDGADLSFADFDSATFTIKERINGQGNPSNKKGQLFAFNETILEKSVFKNVTLNNYFFNGCKADGAVFDDSELKNVRFLGTSLSGCSFKDCYLPGAQFTPDFQSEVENRLPLGSSSFAGSDLENAIFCYVDLIGSEFSGSALSHASFFDSELIAVDFKNTDLGNSNFKNCNLNSANFEQVFLTNAKLINVRLSAANFFKVHGDNVEIITSYQFPTRAVTFRLHSLTGKLIIAVNGAIVEHGYFIISHDSFVMWNNGLHCVGTLFDVKGVLLIDKGLLENTKIQADNCDNLFINSSTIRSSSLEGLDKNCNVINATIESCNLGVGWNRSRFEEAKITLTNLSKNSFGSDFEHLKLADLNFDKNSIAALKSNADSLGHDQQYDRFFNIEKDWEIKNRNEKPIYSVIATILLGLFFVFPAMPYFFSSFWINSYVGYFFAISLLVISSYFLQLSRVTFLKWLYGHGHIPIHIFRSILLIITGFSFSWVSNIIPEATRNIHKVNADILFYFFKEALHFSINSFVAIGFWDNGVRGPQGIMILYSNIEALLGITAMALLVVTIIRRTSGR
jgi:uncharacterized protein YjbI with pentapeptide repeats